METTTLTPKQQFNKLVKFAAHTYTFTQNNEAYWNKEGRLREMLSEMLQSDLSSLSKNDILILCNLLNRHRVTALHVVLRKIGESAKNCPTHKNL